MAIVDTTNYNGMSPTLMWATEDSDQFNRTHVANTAQVFEAHQHSGSVRGGGLPIINVNTSTALAQNGDVRITATAFTYQDTSGNAHTAAALDLANAFTGDNSFAGASTFTGTVTVPVSAGAAPTTSGVIAYDSTANQYKGGSNGTTTVLGAAAPTGSMLAYAAGTNDPSGWLLCDGRSLDNTTYASLKAVIGTAYGSADGSHFNIPDLRSRVVMGADTMGTAQGAAGRTSSGNALGNTSGADTSTALLAHTHTDSGHTHANSLTDNNHTHGGVIVPSSGGNNTSLGGSLTVASGSSGTPSVAPMSITNASAAANISSTGSGTSFSLRQLTQVANWIIKT